MKQRCCSVQFKQAPSSSQQSGQRPDSSEQHSYLYIFASQFLHGFSRAFLSFSLAILILHQRFSVPVHSGLHAALLQRITGEHLWGGSLSSALLFLTLSLIISLSGVDDNVEWSALNTDEHSSLFSLSSEMFREFSSSPPRRPSGVWISLWLLPMWTFKPRFDLEEKLHWSVS